MPLTRRLLSAGLLLLASACAFAYRVEPPFSRLPAPSPRIVLPFAASNLIVNGGFEDATGDDPAGWTISGRARPGALLRAARIAGAPEGRRVAEISLASGGTEPDYGLYFLQDVRVTPWTTYDLSVWVRGTDLVSAVNEPLGFGQQCGLFFWLLGPEGDPATRILPSGAFPRRDGTTSWELRKMRFTTPPADVFPPPAKGGDGRFHLFLKVVLYGTGTIQVDDIRLVPSTAVPPPPRRGPGRLALVRHGTKPLFGFGIHRLPEGVTLKEVAAEEIFNFATGGGAIAEKTALGILSFGGPWAADPACLGCGSPSAEKCAYCRTCPADENRCRAYDPRYLLQDGVLGSWVDEPNSSPDRQGDLEDLIRAARRMKKNAARLLPPGRSLYIFDTDMPGGVFFNTYGWEDLALYHASEAFDIVGTIRRGGNPKKGAVGGRMSEFPETSINGIRESTRRVAGDVTDRRGRQGKPVWIITNGGSGRIVTDPGDRAYRFAPRDAAELLASRPSLPQLRYMLAAAVLNGATGLLFYQDSADTRLKHDDPYWKDVLIPATAELATLERETGFLTQAQYNDLEYRLTGDSGGVDSMLKRVGDSWILAVANSSPEPASGVEFVMTGGTGMAGPPERLVYRHDEHPGHRRFGAVPAGKWEPDRFPLDLPGYGVALYRLRIDSPASSPAPASD